MLVVCCRRPGGVIVDVAGALFCATDKPRVMMPGWKHEAVVRFTPDAPKHAQVTTHLSGVSSTTSQSRPPRFYWAACCGSPD